MRQPPAGFVWTFSKTHCFYYVYFIDSIFINPREVLYAPTSRGFRMTFFENALFLLCIFHRFNIY
jgi:hypothetical protein